MGLGPISHNEVLRYCELMRYDEETTFDMCYHVRMLDNAYLEIANEKHKDK